ncbi:MAG: esterase [Proteobacteria bacterium]|nr:esterase [Pseudomonadota bacterium]
MTTTHLLYLHGFRSSPQSTKAQLMAARVRAEHPAVHWWCPQLPPSPAAAARLIDAGTADWPAARMAVVGSSLGGYYASWLAGRRGCRAVVLNPAVDPARDLAAHIGEQSAWHDPAEHFFFRANYLDELRALQSDASADPTRTLAIIAKGDELLDWREMSARYAGARLHLLDGGDHALSDFPLLIDEVLSFLQLAVDQES